MPTRPSVWAFLAGAGVSTVFVHKLQPSFFFGSIATFFLVLLVEVTCWLTWSWVIYYHFVSPLRHLPTPPNGHWLLGQTRRIMKELAGAPMREWIETIPNDGIIRYSMWMEERIMLTNPKTLGEVLVTKNYEFVKPWHFRHGLGRILGIGILLAEGDEHKQQRKNLMPAFSFRHVKDLYPVFWTKSVELVNSLAVASKSTAPPSLKTDGQPEDAADVEKEAVDAPKHAPGTIEVGNWSSRATLDIIGVAGMGQDFDSLNDPENKLNHTYKTLFNPGSAARWLQVLGLFLPFWLVRRLPIARNGVVEGASEYIKQTCRDMIAKKRQRMEKSEERTEVDILSVALESGTFSDENLVNQMMTFLLAGHETTATAMIWAIYRLCRHPEIQQKLRADIHAHISSLDADVTAADIDGCNYLQAFCSEVLRLHSPVGFTMRTAAHDTSINGQFVPKGTTVILCPFAVNTSKALWGEDALEFRPERWLDAADGKANNKGGADSNYSFLTFLHGPRSCIGQRFAQAEFACLLAAWVGKFETQFEENSPLAEGEPDIKGGITLKPKAGCWVNLKEVEW